MPGVGTTLAYGLVLPFTFAMAPIQGVAFLLAISVGVQYGNSIPAILMGIPGNPAAILAACDHVEEIDRRPPEGGHVLAKVEAIFIASALEELASEDAPGARVDGARALIASHPKDRLRHLGHTSLRRGLYCPCKCG